MQTVKQPPLKDIKGRKISHAVKADAGIHKARQLKRKVQSLQITKRGCKALHMKAEKEYKQQ